MSSQNVNPISERTKVKYYAMLIITLQIVALVVVSFPYNLIIITAMSGPLYILLHVLWKYRGRDSSC